MNIGVNARLLLPNKMEGIARYIFETTKRLALDHPEDTFYMFFDRKPSLKYIFGGNVVPVVVSPQARHPLLYRYWFDHQLPKLFKEYNIDVFYSGDGYMSLKSECPTVIVSHDLAYKHYPKFIKSGELSYYEKRFPKFHKQAKHIVAVSNFTKDDIINQYGIRPEKITVAYNALPTSCNVGYDIDLEKIKQKYTQGQDYFVSVSSIHPRKNTINLIKAYEKYREKSNQCKLLLIGSKLWKTKKFDKAVEKSPYKSDIIHLEHIVGDEVYDIISGAKGMIYISLFEGFGIPILEGFGCRVPVITSNVSSMPEVAEEAALLVDPKDIDEIAQAMLTIENNNVAPELVQKGVDRVKDFSWKTTSDVIYSILKKVYDASITDRYY